MLKGGGPRATHTDACRKRLDEAMTNAAKVQNSKRKINEYVDRRLEKEGERIEKDLEFKKPSTQPKERNRSPGGQKEGRRGGD